MESGLDCGPINKVFFETKTRARFQVEQYLFSHLQFSAGGKLAAALFPQEAIEEMGATADDLDNLASLPRQIEGVSCSITLTQLGAELFKASVRSDEQVDASALCAQFGGGGHARAAGCTLRGEGADCLQRLAAAAPGGAGLCITASCCSTKKRALPPTMLWQSCGASSASAASAMRAP